MTGIATSEPSTRAAAPDSAVPSTGPQPATLGGLLKPVRRRLAFAVVTQGIAAAVGLVPFIAVAELGRALLATPADDERAWLVAWLAVGALVLRLGLGVTAVATTHFADADLQLDLRRRIADRLGRFPLGWFGDRSSGQVKKAMQDDIGTLHHLVAHSLIDLTAAIVTPLLALAYLVWVDWRTALLTLLPVVAGMILYQRAMAGAGGKMVAYDQALGRVNRSAVEFVHGISVVKAFGQAGRAHRRFTQAADDFSTFFGAWASSVSRVSALAEIAFAPVTTLLVVLTGGTAMVTAGWLPAVDLLPAVLLGVALTAPMGAMGHNAQQLRMARLAAANVHDLLATPVLPPGMTTRTPVNGRVVFDRVSFSYGNNVVLRDLDLVLEPGTVTALVGPSGAGKSTLGRLLPRFWDVTAGSVTVGGVDIRELPAAVLYRQAGFVFQDVHLLQASVADNIRLGRPTATDDEVRAAARAAQIHDRIERLPAGYASVIGQEAHLSGGEAQRVCIARALLADPPILVLDEATAFADPESEAAIQQALSTLVTGRTLLVIAHRLSTITGADQIVVLDQQRVAERGRHPDLLARNGLYARMWAAHERAFTGGREGVLR